MNILLLPLVLLSLVLLPLALLTGCGSTPHKPPPVVNLKARYTHAQIHNKVLISNVKVLPHTVTSKPPVQTLSNNISPASKPKVISKSKPKAIAKSPAANPVAAIPLKQVFWAWPHQGAVLRNFQATQAKGIDIAGSLGHPIKAGGKGTVVYSGSGLKGYGNLIIIKHDEDFLSAYAHNDSILVKEGERVTLGQHIATMGKSDTDRVKLHFEIRYRGKPVDPLKFLPTSP